MKFCVSYGVERLGGGGAGIKCIILEPSCKDMDGGEKHSPNSVFIFPLCGKFLPEAWGME